MNGELQQRLDAQRGLALAALRELERAAHELGELAFYAPPLDAATPALRRDPADGSLALVLQWRDAHGVKSGELVINGDGGLFAECDVLRPHPRDPRWFVEAVTVWGREGALASEPRLLQAV